MKLRYFLYKFFLWVGDHFISLANLFSGNRVKILRREGKWVICEYAKFVWRLDSTQYLDNCILKLGFFEPDSVKWVHKLIKPGMVILDVGANFGYYTVQFSKLTGPSGKVYAFEPSLRFRERLKGHLEQNNLHNAVIVGLGLSDTAQEAILYGSGDSATLFWSDDATNPLVEEVIQLDTLDEYVQREKLEKIDFIKVDIDGGDYKFLQGAVKTVERFKPVILMEFAELNLLAAGSNVDELAGLLKKFDYVLYSEHSGKPYTNQVDFRREVKNCSHSINLICYPRRLGSLCDFY